MIKATFGLTKEPFNREVFELLSQQQQILEIIKIHAQHGGFIHMDVMYLSFAGAKNLFGSAWISGRR